MTFAEILDQYNIPMAPEAHHHARQGWVQIDCPFCAKDSQQWHMGYSLEGHFFNCWRCGSHRPIETLMEITGLPFSKCKKILDGVVLVRIKKEEPKGKFIFPKGVGPLLVPHKQYIGSRGFFWEEIRKLWDIRGIGITAKLSWRIFIPIFYHGKIVSWTTRSISNNKKTVRYISASLKQESIPHKSLLYGEDYCEKTIIVTEGPFDVWKIGPGAVATLGTGYSNKQLLRMTNYLKRIICFDSDKLAQKRAKKLCDDLSVYPGETFNVRLDAKDAADASNKEIKLLRKEL